MWPHYTVCTTLLLCVYSQVREKVPVEPREYCIDFAVDLPRQRVYIIELNPFGPPTGMGTGTVLFRSNVDHDLDVLFGRKPFEFRIETRPAVDGAALVKKYAGAGDVF